MPSKQLPRLKRWSSASRLRMVSSQTRGQRHRDVDSPPDEDHPAAVATDVTEIFTYGSKRAFRFERDVDDCPCETVESFGCPLLDVYVRDDALVLVFHVADVETLRRVLEDLHDRWSNVTVHRLIRSGDARPADDFVFVDRSRLAERHENHLQAIVETLDEHKDVVRGLESPDRTALAAAMEKARHQARQEHHPADPTVDDPQSDDQP